MSERDERDERGEIQLRFEECISCRWLQSGRCVRCGAGEFFEESIEEPRELDDDELMQLYSEMTDED